MLDGMPVISAIFFIRQVLGSKLVPLCTTFMQNIGDEKHMDIFLSKIQKKILCRNQNFKIE